MATSVPISSGAQQILHAIHTLLRGPPQEQQAANRWLNEVADQPGTAALALELLRGDQAAEVQFFAANMLLTAVNRQWAKMEPGLQASIQQKLRAEVEKDRQSPGALAWPAVQRLVLVLGSAAAASGPDHLQSAVQYSLSLAAKGLLLVSLELLTAIAESTSGLHRQQRARAMPCLPPLAPDVFRVVHAALQKQGSNRERSGEKVCALKCLAAWLKLDSAETQEALMSAGTFRALQEELFAAMLGLLDERGRESDADRSRLAELVTEVIVHLMSSYAYSEEPEKEEAAMQCVAAALIHRRELGGVGPEMWHNLAQMAASLAAKDTHAIAGHLPEAVPLASLVLECLACGHPGAASEAIDFFDQLNSVPVSERHPHLGPPTYAAMLPHLARLAAYPPGFRSWDEEVETDDGSFHGFRENVLSDALDICQKLLGQQYLEHHAQAVREASNWQEAEAALFALRMYRRKSGPMQYTEGGGLQEDAFLLALMTHLTSQQNAMRSEHPAYLDSLLQLIACNSMWVATAPQELLQAALECTFQGLQAREASHAAAAAFKVVCRDMPQSRAGPLFNGLLPALQPLLQSTGGASASWEDRVEVVQGLAVLIAVAQMGADAACSLSCQLGVPLVERAANLATQPVGENAAAVGDAVAGLLTLVAGALERLEFVVCEGPAEQQQPACCLAQACLPHLRRVAHSDIIGGGQPVASALCKVLKQCLQALGSAGEAVLGQVVQLLQPAFPGDPEGCLQVLTAAVDMSQEWPTSLDSLGATVSQLATAILPQLEDEGVNPDLAAAWFKLLSHCLIDDLDGRRKPLVARVAPAVPQHFAAALRCLVRQEEDLVRATITFIRGALGLDVVNSANTAEACIRVGGEDLVRAILRGVTVSCPQRLMRSLAVLLHSLLNHATYGQPARAAFQAGMLNDEVLVKHLSLEDRQKICNFALNMAPTMVGSFGALIKDMASIARNEMNSEVLLSYQL